MQKSLFIMRFTSFLRIIALPIAISASFSPLPLAAQTEALDEALARIDVSGRQRMFAQRMAGLSCLVSLDIEAETHAREALEIRDQYRETLENLRAGNPEIDITAETDTNVKRAIAAAIVPFEELSDLLSVFETRSTLATQRLQAISVSSSQVFETAATLASQVQASRSSALHDLTLIKSMIINISGRQRMLAEKAFKEFCLAQAGADTQKNLERLDETVRIFDNTLGALINGLPGMILPPPNDEIKTKLEEVRGVWEPVKAILDRALEEEIMDHDEVHFATEELETVRMLMNEAVALYDLAEES